MSTGYTLADRRSPSVNILMNIKDVTLEDALKIKQIWRTEVSRRVAMEKINDILRTHGREYLGRHRRRMGLGVYYLNAGDTYDTTIIQIGVQLTVGCWGDLVEKNLIKQPTQY